MKQEISQITCSYLKFKVGVSLAGNGNVCDKNRLWIFQIPSMSFVD